MKTTTTFAVLFLALFCMTHAQATNVTFDWATVGNPGNAGDVQSQGTFGAVANTYRISKTEVTNGQYTDFLNSVDANGANSLSLFSSGMAGIFGGIELQAANAAGSKFVAQAGREQNPVLLVRFGPVHQLARQRPTDWWRWYRERCLYAARRHGHAQQWPERYPQRRRNGLAPLGRRVVQDGLLRSVRHVFRLRHGQRHGSGKRPTGR